MNKLSLFVVVGLVTLALAGCEQKSSTEKSMGDAVKALETTSADAVKAVNEQAGESIQAVSDAAAVVAEKADAVVDQAASEAAQ